MADGRNSATPLQSTPLWREIFRGFQIALDPRKLLLAAAGIVSMSVIWWLLSVIFFNLSPRPLRESETYSNARIQQELGSQTRPGTNEPYREEDLKRIGDERFKADLDRWRILEELAGPGGRLRIMPWYEFRGENPFIFLSRLLSSPPATWGGQLTQYIQSAIPVLLEPLAKLLLPVTYLANPNVSPLTRFYLILVLLSSILIWAFFAGVITRLAAVQYTRKGPISLKQAITFVTKRYLGYAGGPLLILGLIAFSVLGLVVYGLLGLIPFLGDLVIFGLGLPLILIAGLVMTFFAVGLVAYPLMFVTLSVEGDQSDALDAVSRAMNYLYQAPWRYLGYWAIALIYGAAVTFFLLFFVSLAVYLGKWAVSQTAAALWSSRQPDYLFIYAPPSFGWRELLTAGSPYAVRLQEQVVEGSQRMSFEYVPVNPTAYNEAQAGFYFYNTWGAGLVGLWLNLIFLLMVGFGYSFFWSASTIIYFLLRKVIDEAELDEVYEEEQEEANGPAQWPSEPSTSGSTISLPVTSPVSSPVPTAGTSVSTPANVPGESPPAMGKGNGGTAPIAASSPAPPGIVPSPTASTPSPSDTVSTPTPSVSSQSTGSGSPPSGPVVGSAGITPPPPLSNSEGPASPESGPGVETAAVTLPPPSSSYTVPPSPPSLPPDNQPVSETDTMDKLISSTEMGSTSSSGSPPPPSPPMPPRDNQPVPGPNTMEALSPSTETDSTRGSGSTLSSSPPTPTQDNQPQDNQPVPDTIDTFTPPAESGSISDSTRAESSISPSDANSSGPPEVSPSDANRSGISESPTLDR